MYIYRQPLILSNLPTFSILILNRRTTSKAQRPCMAADNVRTDTRSAHINTQRNKHTCKRTLNQTGIRTRTGRQSSERNRPIFRLLSDLEAVCAMTSSVGADTRQILTCVFDAESEQLQSEFSRNKYRPWCSKTWFSAVHHHFIPGASCVFLSAAIGR